MNAFAHFIRHTNQHVNHHAPRLERASIAMMSVGLLMACQPFSHTLFRWSVAVMLLGLVGANVFGRLSQSPGQGQGQGQGQGTSA